MNDDHSGTPEPRPKKKTTLDDLIPSKKAVSTSVGNLFVRHTGLSDLDFFVINDNNVLGAALVRRLCNRSAAKRDRAPLADDDFSALTDGDFRALAPVIAQHSSWKGLPDGGGLAELGALAKEALAAERAALEEANAKMAASLKSNYAFLDAGVLGKLQGQMADLAKIGSLGGIADSIKRATEESSRFGAPITIANPLSRINAVPTDIKPPPILFPVPEESRLGRATLESAQYARQSSEKIDDLVQIVAGLNQTLISEVLPAWAKKFEEDQEAAKTSFDQAAHGLRWTKWAIVASVVVTFAVGWWQVRVAHAIDAGNTEQQKQVTSALEKQLDAQRKTIEQQVREGEMLREAIRALKQPPAVDGLKK